MKKIKILLQRSFVCIIGFLTINSCKHDNILGFEGPAQCVSANFAITQALNAPASVNFNTDTVIFKAGFNEVVSWTITVTGNTSGASISFSGKSNTINQVWRGNPGSIVFFQIEQVTAVLKVPCRDAVTTTTNIIGLPNFVNCGVLISDFDGHGKSPGVGFYPSVKSSPTAGSDFTGTLGAILFAPGTATSTTCSGLGPVNSPIVSPQGGNYFHVKGTATPANYYYGEAASNTVFSLAPLGTTRADSAYFNALINTNGVSTGMITILLTTSATRYSYQYKADGGLGWKLLSVKLSDFKPATAGPSVNPKNVTAVAFDLGPNTNPGQPCEINLDLVIFTKGQPFF
jgi:hypothetical protein